MRAVLLALNWQFVSLEEDALGDASVLNTGFDDVNRVVFEVEIENALADAEIFGRIFNDWFLEVAFKIQHLKSSVINKSRTKLKQAQAEYNKFNLNWP